MSEEMVHWSKVEGTRKHFFAECQKLHAGTVDVVYRALSLATGQVIEHLEQYTGTVDEALAIVNAYVRDAVKAYDPTGARTLVAQRAQDLPEALGRVSVPVISPAGGRHLVTVSADGSEPAERRVLVAELADYIELLDTYFPKRGFAFLADGRDTLAYPLAALEAKRDGQVAVDAQPPAQPVARRVAQMRAAGVDLDAVAHKAAAAIHGAQLPAVEAAPEKEPWDEEDEDAAQAQAQYDRRVASRAGAKAGPQAGPQAATPAGTLEFPLETITPGNTPKGKRVYKVKGGKWKVHGADCWPEVMDPVFPDAEKWGLGVDQPVAPGVTVVATLNDKGTSPRKAMELRVDPA